MQKHSKSAEKKTHVVALRVPRETYVILLKTSKDWEMSISSLIRELVIKVFNEQDIEEMNKIKSYKKRGMYDRSTSH